MEDIDETLIKIILSFCNRSMNIIRDNSYNQNSDKLLMGHLVYKYGLKISYDDVISAVDDVYNKWDPRTATLLEELCQCKLFSQPSMIL